MTLDQGSRPAGESRSSHPGGTAAWLARRFELGPAEASRLLPMEGLRGCAVILVFFVHYCSLFEPYLAGPMRPVAEQLHLVGHTGVDLFFLLSGYLIYGTLIRRPQPFLGFIARRVQRLYPVFTLVLLVYLALSLLLPAESKLPAGAWNAAVYVVANVLLLPGMLDIRPIITVAWSLSYEMFFYLSVPVLIEVLRLRQWRWQGRVLLFGLAVIALQLLLVRYGRIGMFLGGMILVDALPVLRSHPRLCRVLDPLALGGAAACTLALLSREAHGLQFTAVFVACFLFCGAAFAHRGTIAAWLVARPLRWLGNMSYSYYLLHGLVLKMVFFALASPLRGLQMGDVLFCLLLLPAFGLTLLGSAVLFLLVERPFSILPMERGRRDPGLGKGAAAAIR